MSASGVQRCFIALPVDDVVAADVADALRGVRIDGMRAVAPSNLHVTLKFLGDVEDARLWPMIETMTCVAGDCAAFELESRGFAYLPDARRARVLALDFGLPAALAQLAERMDAALEAAGFPREGRAYRPHVTVGRFRRPPRRGPGVDELGRASTGCAVECVQLMESVQIPGGVRYVELARAKLGR